MKINLKGKTIKDLDGRELPESDMANLVAQTLVQGVDGDAIRLYELALKIKAGDTDLGTSEMELIEGAVKGSKTLTVLAKGQVLIELKKLGK